MRRGGAYERPGEEKARTDTTDVLSQIARRAVAWPLVVVVAGVGVLACSPSGALAAFAGVNGRIAYGYESAFRTPRSYGEQALIAVQPDGKDAQPLKRCVRLEGKPPEGECSIAYRSPAYSPDGARIAFDAGGALALMNSDGSGLRLLRQATSDDGQPAWSPTGRRLVFAGASGDG